MNPSNLSQSPLSAEASGSENAQQEASGALSNAKQKIKTATRDTVKQIKTAATDTAGRVKEQASEIVDQQKTGVADRIGSYSSAVHKTAESLEQNDPNIAWLTHQAADRLSGVADYIRGRDFTQLKSDAENLARRHPAAFFGGLFVAGLVVGNLLKATGRAAVDSSNGNKGSDTDSYPRAESVPATDIPGEDPWPSEPRAESLP